MEISNDSWQDLLNQILKLSQKSGQMSDDELRKELESRKNDLSLIQKWVAASDHPAPIQASLCFYTWEPLAKVMYWLEWKKPIPLDRQKVDGGPLSAEAERVKAQCRRLGLISSELRMVKDVKWKPDGNIEFVFFKQLLSEG